VSYFIFQTSELNKFCKKQSSHVYLPEPDGPYKII